MVKKDKFTFLNPKDRVCRICTDRKSGKLKIDSTCAILSVKNAGLYTVYDLEIEKYHNFFAGNICVHNSSHDPNLQNIPSRHSDIRHMFRATPESEEVTDCQEINGEVVVTLGRLDTVYLKDGTEKQVKDLSTDDEVEILDNKKGAYLRVSAISDSPPYSTIRFSR